MQTPVEIDFQGMKPMEPLRKKVTQHVSGLEDRFGRITACRVTVKAPGQHHRIGVYEISVHLTLPNGKQVDVDHTPRLDERYTDIDFAINDTFKRARRRLQDQVRRLQGMVKTHQNQPTGIVSKLDESFGFLRAEDGHEVYFHRRSVLNDAFTRLKVGTRVTFSEESGEKGPQASTVKLQGKHHMR